MRRASVLVWVIVCAAGVLCAPSSLARTDRTASVRRCGLVGSPYGPLGVYPALGHVSCAKSKALIERSFNQAGIPVGTGESRYRDGWVCGGQMGYYFCNYPYRNFSTGKYTQMVDARACRLRGVGCPGRVREEVS
jgi:hypothetical protein